ncbi:MAG: hypothetical protein OXF73_07160 [Gammaproteobacteria bacterium]|nr:hypothetical protein [Gammaproteobacteria bacterium]MCY4228267.1 hypothetical protein [Gammaproteobacteria bacterium]
MIEDLSMPEDFFQADDRLEKSVIKVAHVVYLLQALSFFVPFILLVIAVIINHVKKPDARGTWLESHFAWQIRTFWHGLLWIIAGSLLCLVTAFISVPLAIGIVILAGVGITIWFLYRIIKGWLRLNDGKPMYADQ